MNEYDVFDRHAVTFHVLINVHSPLSHIGETTGNVSNLKTLKLLDLEGFPRQCFVYSGNALRNGVLRSVIIVYDATNEAYMIVDGQHLTEALKELGMRIDCVVKECETEADITQLMIDLNNTSKSWTLENYINGWAESGVKSYRILKNFAIENNLPITTIMQAFTQKSRSETTKLVKEGRFDIANKIRGEELIGYINECVTILPRTRQVTESLIKLMLRSESYNHKKMMKSLKTLPKNHKVSSKENEIYAELVELYEG